LTRLLGPDVWRGVGAERREGAGHRRIYAHPVRGSHHRIVMGPPLSGHRLPVSETRTSSVRLAPPCSGSHSGHNVHPVAPTTDLSVKWPLRAVSVGPLIRVVPLCVPLSGSRCQPPASGSRPSARPRRSDFLRDGAKHVEHPAHPAVADVRRGAERPDGRSVFGGHRSPRRPGAALGEPAWAR